MPFKFQIHKAEYEGTGEDAVTVLRGAVVEGELVGPESICLQTRSGVTYRFWMEAMEVEGPQIGPLRPEHGCSISLVVGGHPPDCDIVEPSVGIADGHEQ